MPCLAAAALSLCVVTSPGYNVADFSDDCRLSGGRPRLYAQSVVCEAGTGQDIHCVRAGQLVQGCTLGDAPAPGKTHRSARPYTSG